MKKHLSEEPVYLRCFTMYIREKQSQIPIMQSYDSKNSFFNHEM